MSTLSTTVSFDSAQTPALDRAAWLKLSAGFKRGATSADIDSARQILNGLGYRKIGFEEELVSIHLTDTKLSRKEWLVLQEAFSKRETREDYRAVAPVLAKLGFHPKGYQRPGPKVLTPVSSVHDRRRHLDWLLREILGGLESVPEKKLLDYAVRFVLEFQLRCETGIFVTLPQLRRIQFLSSQLAAKSSEPYNYAGIGSSLEAACRNIQTVSRETFLDKKPRIVPTLTDETKAFAALRVLLGLWKGSFEVLEPQRRREKGKGGRPPKATGPSFSLKYGKRKYSVPLRRSPVTPPYGADNTAPKWSADPATAEETLHKLISRIMLARTLLRSGCWLPLDSDTRAKIEEIAPDGLELASDDPRHTVLRELISLLQARAHLQVDQPWQSGGELERLGLHDAIPGIGDFEVRL